MPEGLEHELQNLQNDCEVPDVIRIAAQAALIMVSKYYALTDDCEVYRISISESQLLCTDILLINTPSHVPKQARLVSAESRLA